MPNCRRYHCTKVTVIKMWMHVMRYFWHASLDRLARCKHKERELFWLRWSPYDSVPDNSALQFTLMTNKRYENSASGSVSSETVVRFLHTNLVTVQPLFNSFPLSFDPHPHLLSPPPLFRSFFLSPKATRVFLPPSLSSPLPHPLFTLMRRPIFISLETAFAMRYRWGRN